MRSKTRDPLVRPAVHLRRIFAQRQQERERGGGEHFADAVQSLLRHQREVECRWNRACKAAAHGWTMAAASERRQLAELAGSTRAYVDDVMSDRPHDLHPAPPLGDLLAELRQLEDEFDGITVRFRPLQIAVVTKPITLEGVRLGRFEVVLQVDRLADRPDATAFACVALDPNPAAASEDTPHPHVRGDVLCTGEATVPIGAALRDGRVCDAFLMIGSVLRTYNDGSAYIGLDAWSGVACADCGYTRDEDSMYRCGGCRDEVCEECVGCCDACSESYCQPCLECERGDGDQLCPGCRTSCPRCGLVAASADVEERGVCDFCHEEDRAQARERDERERKQEQDDDDDDDDTNEDNGQPDEAAAASPAIGSGAEVAEGSEVVAGAPAA